MAAVSRSRSRVRLGAVAIGCLIYYGLYVVGWGPGPGNEAGTPELAASELRAPGADPGLAGLVSRPNGPDAIRYLPVAIPPGAVATVVGGIDCTESAASVGDEYPTGQIIAAEGLATLVGGLFGGVIQSTPYIGHPAYKAMGARSAYTLATALFVGAAGIFGFFDWIFFFIPKAVIFPILIFVGLEITSQSFHATAVRHYPAVALACVPALAYLAVLAYKQLLPELKPFADLQPPTQHWIQTVTVLAGGGSFIVTSLLWATAARLTLIDGRIRPLVATLLTAAVFSWFGIIHSPLASSPIMSPSAVIRQLQAEGRAEATAQQTPYHWAGGYAAPWPLDAAGSLPIRYAAGRPKRRTSPSGLMTKGKLTVGLIPGTPYLTRRPSLGSWFLPSQDPAQLLFERRQKRLLSQWSAGMLVGTQDFEVLFANDPGEEAAPLGGQLEQGRDPHQRVVPSSYVGGGAAPPITAWCLDQPRAHGVELNVRRGGQQIRLIEHE